MTIRVLGIAGSLRAGSLNRMLLEHINRLQGPDRELVTWDRLAEVPPFNEDDETRPASSVRALRHAITEADAVLVATPEYNGSIPGQLKNALDWASRPYRDSALQDKPVAAIGASPSSNGAARAQADVRTVLNRIGANVLDRQLAISQAHHQFDGTGALLDPALNDDITRLIDELVTAAAPTVELA